MTVKDVLKERVPEILQSTPEFSVFLTWISEKNIDSTSDLKSALDNEIMDCQATLEKSMSDSHGGTNTTHTRECAKKLDFLKFAKDKIVQYI